MIIPATIAVVAAPHQEDFTALQDQRMHVQRLSLAKGGHGSLPTRQFWDSGGVKLESLCNFSIVGCQWTVNCLLGIALFPVY